MAKEEKLTKELYNQQAEREWQRLVKDPFHKLEIDTTLHFLKKHLPKKGTILDAGGGPGRYSIELAKMGYKVVLLDLAQANLDIAKKEIKKTKTENNVTNLILGSITDLSIFKSNIFDAVLCLGGPLSHVHPEKQRKKAISELIRVAKNNSPIFISVMGKYGCLLNALRRWPDEVAMKSHFENLALKGNDYMWQGGKGFSHFFTLNELTNLLNKKLKILDTVGLEGLATATQDELNNSYNKKKIYKNWINTHYKLCAEPTVADLSLHFLIIGRKK